jgi:hypothetical protein
MSRTGTWNDKMRQMHKPLQYKNMTAIFDLVYILAFLSYLILSLFIVYHIVRYSGSKTVMVFTLTFFLVGTALLLLANSMLFLSIPFGQFAPNLPTPAYMPNSPFN